VVREGLITENPDNPVNLTVKGEREKGLATEGECKFQGKVFKF
jgi:hypothetical protein